MSAPENLLVSSRLEIRRMLGLLAKERSSISAELQGAHLFTSHILSIEPDNGHFVVAYCANKLINAMLLDSATVEFTATNHQELHFSFEASAPEEALFEGQPAIQFAMPTTVLLHNRREHPRIPVGRGVSLRCIADEAGVISFESHVTDISHDGVGCLIYDADISLEPGTILRGSRIVLPNGDAVIADLELRHSARTVLPDGTVANTAGFRFVQKSDDLAKLIKQYMRELNKR